MSLLTVHLEGILNLGQQADMNDLKLSPSTNLIDNSSMITISESFFLMRSWSNFQVPNTPTDSESHASTGIGFIISKDCLLSLECGFFVQVSI